MSQSASGRARNAFRVAFSRATDHLRRKSTANAVAFEDVGSPLSAGRLHQEADAHRPWWARQYLRLWRATYVRYGIALPLPRALRKPRRP